MRTVFRDLKAKIGRLCPTDGIGDDPLHVGVIVGATGFVAGLEIKDLARTATEART